MTTQWYDQGLSFQCTQCGNCCTGPTGYVWFNDREAAEMAALLKISVHEFREQYAHQVNGWWTLNEVPVEERGYDCVFLRWDDQGRSLCSVYSARPRQCRTWPFWPENLRSKAAWNRAAQNCPGMRDGGRFYPVEEIRIIRDSNQQP